MMQRSPPRKSPRLQAAASLDNSSSTSAESVTALQQIAPPVSNATVAAAKTTTAMPPRNILNTTGEVQQDLPPLIPGPSVRFQQPQSSSSKNVSTDMQSLQRQIETLQMQLFNAQRALKAVENTNMGNIEQNFSASVSTTPVLTGNNFEAEEIIERRNPTPYSTTTSSYQGQQQLLTTQPINNQVCVPSMHTQRKIYDLPEFYGTPEDWPIFVSAFEHSTAAYCYNNFENCLRLQKALKGEAKECVKSLLIHPNNVSTVIEQLKLQYGRPEVLIKCQLQQIKEIQPIGENAVDKLIPYSIKVRNLAAFLEVANGRQHSSNPTLMEELVQKLPMSKRLDWAQFASTLQQWPSVLDFSTWLQQIANLVRSVQTTNPVASRPNCDSKRKIVLYAADSKVNQLKCHYCLRPLLC